MPASERHGYCTKSENRMPAGENAIGFHEGYRASGSDRKISANEFHANHIAGFEVGIFRRRSRGTASHCRHAPGRKLFSELCESFGIKAGGNQRSLNRHEKLTAASARLMSVILGQGDTRIGRRGGIR